MGTEGKRKTEIRERGQGTRDRGQSDEAVPGLKSRERCPILDLLVAASGYRMTAMVSNSFGVQLAPDMERMPGSTLP